MIRLNELAAEGRGRQPSKGWIWLCAPEYPSAAENAYNAGKQQRFKGTK
jgi:hypothetical protein